MAHSVQQIEAVPVPGHHDEFPLLLEGAIRDEFGEAYGFGLVEHFIELYLALVSAQRGAVSIRELQKAV